jgi:hypothetical protein
VVATGAGSGLRVTGRIGCRSSTGALFCVVEQPASHTTPHNIKTVDRRRGSGMVAGRAEARSDGARF